MFEAVAVATGLQSELARLSSDGRDRSVGELVDLVGDCQSVINQATALQSLAMAHLAAIEDVELEDGTVVEQHRGLGHQRLDAPDLVSEQLGMSTAATCTRMGVAVDVVTRLGGVFAAMAQGLLDGYRAGIVSDELREAPAEVCEQVVARIAETLGTEPPAALRRRVRGALAAVDADLLRAKAARARSERKLCRWPGSEPGVDTWMGSFPVEQSRSGWAVVDGLARQYVRDGRATGLEQARADALMDLIHARATGTFVVQLAVPADQMAGATSTGPSSPAENASGPKAPDASAKLPDDATDAMTVGASGGATVRPSGEATVGGKCDPPVGANGGTTRNSTGVGAGAPTDAAAATFGAASARQDGLVTVSGFGMPGSVQVRQSWLQALVGVNPALGGGAPADPKVVPGSATPSQPGRGVRREVVLCHGTSGALLALADGLVSTIGWQAAGVAQSTAYRPPAAMIDLVKARDGRCRFPGCSVNARFCDVDHVMPWPLGPTHPTNLMCLCRRHHRVKQTVRWRVRIDPEATVTWTDPTGRLRTTLPLDFLQLDRRADAAGSGLPRQEMPSSDVPGAPGADPPAARTTSGPDDTTDVRWSAWEEELAHEMARAERRCVRFRPDTRRTDEPLGPPMVPELRGRLAFFTIDPAVAGTCPGRRIGRVTKAESDPPF
jgi:hypothetical protein